MSKAAQGFSPEAYFKYVEGGNPRPPARRAYASERERRIGRKDAFSGWKLVQDLPYALRQLFHGEGLLNEAVTAAVQYLFCLAFYAVSC